MNAKTTIRKILFITLWLAIGAGMLTLLLAAIGKKNRERCSDYSIIIKGTQNNFFVDEKDVQQILMEATNGKIRGQLLSLFNLHQMEQLLENNTWIKDAELYFDNQEVLHITVTESEPVARIFTISGNSFYIDSTGRKMPLSDKLSARVPVFTGFPDNKIVRSKDSALLNDVKKTAQFIFNDPFWMAQVAQVDITPDRNFEMIPVVGNHIVKLGDGEDIQEKFQRLFVFYKQVLSKTGFDAYKLINVQYKGQVIAMKENATAKIDSVQLRKNVEKLLKEAQEEQIEPVITTKPGIEKPAAQLEPGTIGMKSSGTSTTDTTVTTANNNQRSNNPNAVKTTSVSKPGEKLKNDPGQVNEKKVPKAVMPKRD